MAASQRRGVSSRRVGAGWSAAPMLLESGDSSVLDYAEKACYTSAGSWFRSGGCPGSAESRGDSEVHEDRRGFWGQYQPGRASP